jgi:hypothetical protein
MSLIEECIDLQLELNNKIDPNWTKAKYNWQLYAIQELAEMIDHIGYKHWNLKEPDYPQAFIELIDILHFVVSDLLTSDIYKMSSGMIINKLHNLAKEPPKHIDPNVLMRNHCGAITLEDCFELLGYFKKAPEEMFQMYLAKDVLNIFRQDHGYKSGKYNKIWGGVEDNVHLDKIVVNFNWEADLRRQRIYMELQEQYMRTTMGVTGK